MPLNLVFTQAGDFTIEDNGIPGDNISVIKDGAGIVIFTFAHPVDALGLTVNVPGVNLTINFTDTLGAADFSIGSLTDPAVTPDSVTMRKVETTGDVTIVSNSSITEGGSDAAADIVAGTLIMSAANGVGTGANAIETQTSFIEAETTTGGINIGNTGSVQIGGLTDLVNGLDVLTSGNLTLTALGSIFLSDVDLDPGTNPPLPPAQSVHGGDTSGNVSLTANGFLSDIITNTDTDAISAPSGNITLTAGRDIAFGTIGVDFDNDVRANGNVTINAGRDFLLDGFSDLSSDDFFNDTGGDVIINTGRNIHLRNIAGDDATITASGSAGADVIFTTGFSGAVILDAPSATAVQSASGDVIVNADRMLIGAASGITANAGQVVIRPSTSGRQIFLGSASDAALALELSDAEIDRIFSPTLTIGSSSSGSINAVGAFGPANIQDLRLISASNIALGSALTVAGVLRLRAGDDVQLLSASATTAGSLVVFVDETADDGGIGGVTSFLGALTAGSSSITGNADADTLNGTGGDDIINGLGGDDTIDGGAGFDTINGGDGNDTLTGGGDGTAETVHGNVGNDSITSTGEGSYFGDGGDDLIVAGLSLGVPDEILDGGDGIDTLDVTSFTGDYAISLATGTTGFAFESFVNFENLVTGDGADTLAGTSGANTIRSGDNKDIVTGGNGADTLIGEGGPDTLFGNAGNDTLFGGTGDDKLIGGVGKDTMTGNAALDQFTFLDGDTAATRAGADVITDFNQTHKDLIKLKAMDADTTLAGDQKFQFIGAGAFTGVARQLHFVQDGGNTFIEGDTDGDGTADFVIRLNGLHTLVGADFVL